MKIKIERKETCELEVELPVFKKWYDWQYAILKDELAVAVYPNGGINVIRIDTVFEGNKSDSTKEEFTEAFNKEYERFTKELETIKNSLK